MTEAAPQPAALTIRDAAEADLPAIRDIYAHHVLHGLASFEIEPPDLAEIARRWRDYTGRGMPYLVACEGNRVRGFAYAAPYRPRAAYRHTVEDSVYVAPDAHRQGIGLALIDELVACCTALGFRQMVAVIGDSGNAASIRLHERAGFRRAGTLKSVGRKFDRWVDIVTMQRALGPGDASDPGPGDDSRDR